MADVHSEKIRSYNMSCIRSTDTKPERVVRKFLFLHGFRFRLHVRQLPGKPDIVLKKYNTAIFVNGCFWHMHNNCKFFQMPATNHHYWYPKLQRNREKDKQAIMLLRKKKIKVVVIWECQLRGTKATRTLNTLLKMLKRRSKLQEL